MTSYKVEMRRTPDLDDKEVARRLHQAYTLILSWSESTDDVDTVGSNDDHTLSVTRPESPQAKAGGE